MASGNIIQRVASRAARDYRDTVSKIQVRNSLKHVTGEKYIHLPEGEVAVILIGRNMSHFLEYFYDYYVRLGAKYFVYTDNGSTDNTMSIVSKWKNAVILSTDLYFRDFEMPIRREISTRYCSDGWRLAVDPDELFDYIGSGTMSLSALGGSLRRRGYNGLVAQMLDLVPDASLGQHASKSFEESVRLSRYYSLNEISAFDYDDPAVPFAGMAVGNVLPDPIPEWKFGGLRKQYFDENCCLTKHPFFYHTKGVMPFRHPHLTTGLRLADFTALLKHYKFSGNHMDRESDWIVNNRVGHNETTLRASVIGTGLDFRFDITTMDADPTPDRLVDQAFLSMSESAKAVYL